MRKLLSAGFMRLWKSRIFWLVLAGCVLIPLTVVFTEYQHYRVTTYTVHPEDAMFNIIPIMIFVCPVLISLFQGTEYSDGTVRNKLICGHMRRDILFSGLIVCSAASVLMLLVCYGVTFLATCLYSPEIQMTGGHIVYYIFCSAMVTMALSAICMLVTVFLQKKAAAAVGSVILIVLLLFGSSYLDSLLREPETNYGAMVMHEDGKFEFVGEEPNPLYISGVQRDIIELAFDITPTGQSIQINNQDFARSARWPLLSLAVTVAVSVVGLIVFKKKDIQ